MDQFSVDANCQNLMSILYQSEYWDLMKEKLLRWKQKDKNEVEAINIFQQFMGSFQKEGKCEEKFIQAFNKCLVANAQLLKKDSSSLQEDHNQKNENQDCDFSQEMQDVQQNEVGEATHNPPAYEQMMILLHDRALKENLRTNFNNEEITKIIFLFCECIISLDELKSLFFPLSIDPSLFYTLIQHCERIEAKRRQKTVFCNVEKYCQDYPVQQVGHSYIVRPQCYANHGKNWKQNPLQSVLNRKYTSVPLGEENQFEIGTKNEYEKELFLYEEGVHDFDIEIQTLNGCEKKIKSFLQRTNGLTEIPPHFQLKCPTVKRIFNQLYVNELPFEVFTNYPSLVEQVFLPRIIQKRGQVRGLREKFIRQNEQRSEKLFKKSLDYRSYSFTKNENNFNCPSRWISEIEMRKKEIISEEMGKTHKKEINEDSLRPREQCLNTFDNITKDKMFESLEIAFNFDRKKQAQFPSFPDNQVLFVLNFQDSDVLNDVLQILFYHVKNKTYFERIVFKTLKIRIKGRIMKSETYLNILSLPEEFDMVEKVMHEKELKNQKLYESLLNPTVNGKKKFPFEKREMEEMLEVQEQANIEEVLSPFEGPSDHTLIGTKQIYIFLRSLLTIYQRFLKAKEYSHCSKKSVEEAQNGELYQFFLNSLIFAFKEKEKRVFEKNKSLFEEYLMKIFNEKAFVFFGLEGLIRCTLKTVNSIRNGSLTCKILHDQMNDFEYGITGWESFKEPNITSQLTKVWRQKESLFRFTFEEVGRNVFISSWKFPENPDYSGQWACMKEVQSYLVKKVDRGSESQKKEDVLVSKERVQYLMVEPSNLMPAKGSEVSVKRKRSRLMDDDMVMMMSQLSKRKKMEEFL